MKRSDSVLKAFGVFGLCTGFAILAYGQQMRYMDSSGNLHFVDNLKQVPRQYREQIVPPTPTPVLDKKALQQKRYEEQVALRERQAEERRKHQEEIRVQREQELKERQQRKQRDQERRSSSFTGK